jgi:hypothetical protein
MGRKRRLNNTASLKRTPLRLVLFDKTERHHYPWLSYPWSAGAILYRAMGWIDGAFGASSWEEGLQWLVDVERKRPIGEIQYWGHGKWGRLYLNGRELDMRALEPGNSLYPYLEKIRTRLSGQEARWWFRCCETFGARPGHQFARAWSAFFNCHVAGHTFIIGFFQSGLHILEPGAEPSWPDTEGLAEGTPECPLRAHSSMPGKPHTITCMEGGQTLFSHLWDTRTIFR